VLVELAFLQVTVLKAFPLLELCSRDVKTTRFLFFGEGSIREFTVTLV